MSNRQVLWRPRHAARVGRAAAGKRAVSRSQGSLTRIRHVVILPSPFTLFMSDSIPAVVSRSRYFHRAYPHKGKSGAHGRRRNRVVPARSPQGRARPWRPGCSCILLIAIGQSFRRARRKKAQRSRGVSLGCHLRAAYVASCMCVSVCTYVYIPMYVCAYYSAYTWGIYIDIVARHIQDRRKVGASTEKEKERAKERKRSERADQAATLVFGAVKSEEHRRTSTSR